MKRKRYSAKKKQAIIEAVKQARKGGGKWAAAYEAAKKAGYKGSSPGLYQFIRGSGPKRRKTWTKRVASLSSAGSIQAHLAALVDKAVNDRLAEVIAELAAMK